MHCQHDSTHIMRIRKLIVVLWGLTIVHGTTSKYLNTTAIVPVIGSPTSSPNTTSAPSIPIDCSADAIPAECFPSTLPLSPIALSCNSSSYSRGTPVSTRIFSDYCRFYDAYWANQQFYAYEDRCLASWCTASIDRRLATETGPYTKYVTTVLTFLPVSTSTLSDGNIIIDEGSIPVTSTATCTLNCSEMLLHSLFTCYRGTGSSLAICLRYL